ncbi:cell division protein FtsX [Flavobacterium croceum DSM 17960]|uniref:Cell division protein FtsX n=1 Tax=Flavobacterium croceum DSM 17960 TaxID=1121886 RepID=A0A2S4N6D0_9FLAO|nr:permease-like cell division protein FtsX [Flavobacterium croceum]POS01264.1 cell division protein FtsX [Flavobacterium croceum DSM 17960]
MASSFDKFQKRRVLTSYVSVVLSIFLVLFLLGVLALFLINSHRLSDNFKEDIVMTVFLKNEATDADFKAFDAELKTSKFAKDWKFVSKEQAAKQHKEVIGEDFMQFLGANPLYNSYDIHLKAAYVTNPAFSTVAQKLRSNPMVSDIVYDRELISLVNDNIKNVSFWILIISGIFTLISVLLINSSLRLSIYANRFIIKTMQMVGATKAFIRKPFILRSMLLGLIGSILAIIFLLGALFYVDTNFPGLEIFTNIGLTILVLVGVLVVGLLITWISTYFATQRFLNLRTDDLY